MRLRRLPLSRTILSSDLLLDSRLSGKQIVFVSDTYLSANFVRSQLVKHGVAEPDDRCYVSSELGVTKRHGGLFKVLITCEGVSPSEIHHFGDNSKADVAIPESLGIRATQIPSQPLNRVEQNLLRKCISSPQTVLRLAGSMRVARVSPINGQQGLPDLIGSFLGPLTTIWACWTLAAAERDGVRRLYFVSRDAYLVCRAALPMRVAGLQILIAVTCKFPVRPSCCLLLMR